MIGAEGSDRNGSGAERQEDLLTCGDCLQEFCLSDIVSFIRHKVSHGTARSCRTASDHCDDPDVATAAGG